ncbi:MAG TPA: DUF362 domain-containing protein [Opitutaceae bacterium]|nr:DUF362 domain-containing protein [Opitutaceae bacterium]
MRLSFCRSCLTACRWLLLPAALLFGGGLSAQTGGGPGSGPALPPPAPLLPVWETSLQNFDQTIYEREVERLFVQFESATGRQLQPGVKRKVGLKIYADSGQGLSTPHALVHAVISALERRGFDKGGIFLVGLNQLRLRLTGFLPSLVTGETAYKGHPVFVLESGRFFDPVWFYDSPLPNRFDPILAEKQIEGVDANSSAEQDRKSFLATPLFLDADFWINLPVYTDHSVLGVNGALVNATLWNASNTARFFRSPANAPAAVAEMSAIPELRATWAFTIASLERYQFIGGPYFNSLYTVSEPRLWLSADPVAMDTLALGKINYWRKRSGFQAVADEIRTLEFAETLGVGTARSLKSRLVILTE